MVTVLRNETLSLIRHELLSTKLAGCFILFYLAGERKNTASRHIGFSLTTIIHIACTFGTLSPSVARRCNSSLYLFTHTNCAPYISRGCDSKYRHEQVFCSRYLGCRYVRENLFFFRLHLLLRVEQLLKIPNLAVEVFHFACIQMFIAFSIVGV